MDKIYSRKRMKLPNADDLKFGNKNRKIHKIGKTLCIIFITIITAFYIIRGINPIFNSMCIAKARAISTEIINVESSKAFTGIDYEDLVNIVKDNERGNKNAQNKYSKNKFSVIKYCI